MVKQSVDASPEVFAQIKSLYGGYNDIPPGWHEMTEADIARSHLALYAPMWTQFRQILLPGEPYYLSVRLMFMHDNTGYAMAFDQSSGRVRWFGFGCVHAYVGLSQQECAAAGIYHGGQCFHVSRCERCGYVRSVDSSD